MIHRFVLILMIPTVIGCSQSDERLEHLAHQALQSQAQQNRDMAQQSREVTEASKRLVEADAKARQETIELQSQLIERDAQGRAELDQLVRETHTEIRTDERHLDQQRAALELERQRVARARQREPVIAESIQAAGLLLACLLPLLLAGYVLYTLNRPGDDDVLVGQLLVQELTADEPLLLPRSTVPPALRHEDVPAHDEPLPD